jgi:alanine racemase
LVENLRAAHSVAGAGAEVLAVIKADAYGHGAAVCAPVLVGGGAKWLGVNDVEEGARVRAVLGEGSTRLLVMCGMELADAGAMVAHGLTPVVWTAEHVMAMERAARSAGQRLSVHLEIDTGMGRQGAAVAGTHVLRPELERVLERLASSRWVICEGVMTHLCCSEVADAGTTAAQRERFEIAVEQVVAAGVKPEFLHVANTSAVDEGSTLAWMRETAKHVGARAMVRAGFGIYGHALPLEHAEGRVGALGPRLKPVAAWKTRVIGMREVETGATVGYGATFTAQSRMRLALLGVGYADGFRREASSGLGDGWVMIAGQRAPVVGRVSMNLTVVDVTGIAKAGEGSEVVLLGDGVTAEDHAQWCGTIPYEILCGIRARFELR